MSPTVVLVNDTSSWFKGGAGQPNRGIVIHQCVRFSINRRRSHEQPVMQIWRYLFAIKNRGMIYKPNLTKGLEVFVDLDFAGSLDSNHADDIDTDYSRTGFVICCTG